MKSFKINNLQRKKLLSQINFIEQKINPTTLVLFAKVFDVYIRIYATNTLLLQGNKAKIVFFLNKFSFLSPKVVPQDDTINKLIKIPYFGGDESGVGDLFGPLVLTVVYLDENFFFQIKTLKIKDSKELTDVEIKILAPKLMKYKKNYVVKIVSNLEFNDQFFYKMNLKELMTFYYFQAINDIIHLNPKKEIVIDGYTTKALFEKYCLKLKLSCPTRINLIPKSENKYLAVAVASIISRFIFLQEISKIEKFLKISVLLGAVPKVKQLVKELQQKRSQKDLTKCLKINYRGVKI